MIEVIPVETPSLGDRSYIATDGNVAIVIDPQRDYDRVLAMTGARGVRITHVFETHVHNDYVTGGLRLAGRVGAAYVGNADDPVAFERVPARDGEVFDSGRLRIRALHTPGHTFTHLSYAVAAGDHPVAVFTGGCLLRGSTGRPDLLGAEHTDTLARHQYHSARRIAAELPAEAVVYPTHGVGSFCAATQLAGLPFQPSDAVSTIAAEAASNPVFTLDEEAYVRLLLAGLDAYPAYYAHLAPVNGAGPTEIDLSPADLATPAELRRRIEAGEWVVDLRHRTAYAAEHLSGTLNIGFDRRFVTYLGWLLPWGTPVTLLGEDMDQVAAAQRDMARIGIDRPAAAAIGSPVEWAAGRRLASIRTVTFAELRVAMQGDQPPYVLDVRRYDERRRSRILGSRHIPLHELPARLSEVPAGETVWVHCAAGYRAALAASLLDRDGVRVVLIDDAYDRVTRAGVPTRTAA